MDKLNLSSYIQVMRTGLSTHDKQEPAAKFLLGSINEQDYVKDNGLFENLDSKRISLIISRDRPVPDGIKQASSIPEVIDSAISYFRKEVAADLNPHMRDDVVGNLIRLIEVDSTIPDAKKKSLMAALDAQDDILFLAEVFFYAVNRPNKKTDDEIEPDDIPMLAEVDYVCPLCNKDLVVMVKGAPRRRYRITQVYPEALTEEEEAAFTGYPAPEKRLAPENLIALHEDRAEEYLINPTLEEYLRIKAAKEESSRRYRARIAIDAVQLEEDIRVVLRALSQLQDGSRLEEMEYEALRVDEKIEPSNFNLKAETVFQVVTYYRYIESVFAESAEDFDIIASEIKTSSKKLEKEGLSQDEVVRRLSEWIRGKAQLGEDAKPACRIVVSFFIQNCDVFEKRSKEGGK